MNALALALAAGFNLWMLVDCARRRANPVWYIVILLLMPIGGVIYYLWMKLRESPSSTRIEGEEQTPLFGSEEPPAGTNLDALRFAVEQTPSQDNKVALARGLHDLGELVEAMEIFEGVLHRRDDAKPALHGLGLCRLARGDGAGAAEVLEKLLEVDRAYLDFAAWQDLARAYALAGDGDKEMQALRRMVKASPRMAHKVLLAEGLARQGNPGEASGMAREALDDHEHAPSFVQKQNREWVARARSLAGAQAT